MDIYIIWIITQYYFIFFVVVQIVPAWPLRALSVGSCVFLMFPMYFFFNFLAVQDAPGSFCIFIVPVLESVERVLVPFNSQ